MSTPTAATISFLGLTIAELIAHLESGELVTQDEAAAAIGASRMVLVYAERQGHLESHKLPLIKTPRLYWMADIAALWPDGAQPYRGKGGDWDSAGVAAYLAGGERWRDWLTGIKRRSKDVRF